MTIKRAATVAVLSLAVIGLTPIAASAGEVTGSGETLPVNARSECAYSGLEDDPIDPGTTQNWGTIPKEFRDFLSSNGVRPSTLCNGHLNPIK